MNYRRDPVTVGMHSQADWLPGDDDVACPACDEDQPDPSCQLCGGKGVCRRKHAKAYGDDERGHDRANNYVQERD